MKVFDCLKREIKVGDTIAYCVAAGRAQVQNFYTVLEINDTLKNGTKVSPYVVAQFAGGHSWGRDIRTARKSTLCWPETRAILMPRDLKLPEVWRA